MGTASDLDRHLVEFAQLLRTFGLRLSASEILDAMQGLMLVGLEDKGRVEAVLQATLVKDANQIPWFREAFRAYFAPPEHKQAWEAEAAKRAAERNAKLEQSRQELRFQGRELDIPEEQRAIYAQLPEEEQERLRKFLERSSEGMKLGVPLDQSFQPMVERAVRGSLDYWRRKLDEEGALLPPGSDDGVTSEVEKAMREREIQLLARDLKQIPPEDWPQVIKLIRRLSQRLASQVSRRYRAARRRGGVDMRRTLRQNLRYGGVLVERRYKSRHTSRPRFVLLCDMSASMLKYTEFVLQFVYGLSSVAGGIEIFAFADHVVRLTEKIHKGQSFAQMVEEAMPQAGNQWGGGTNMAISLAELITEYPHVLSKRSVLLILSDAQTLDGEQAASLLERVRRQVREVLWLNTVPAKRWREVPTIEMFKPYCQMYECYTLGHLTNILKERL